ncbi:preprotein translocase subunit SecE [Candidatus Parcubacteria bacterium]|nr:preprotein translocase subunit SecE [Candidatus Parcubacteria bacterium]
MNKLVTFLKEVRVEMSKVIWPTRNQMVVYTLVVIGLSAVLALFLGVVDFGFQAALNKLLLK